ncbi:PepSY-associated TM helix domain-containing protein [Sunxiuqinia rutila]|uniref:PepSY-associated TM helix domain-containing protein n=1 Tax=Sunxiuqinia rutila TaxID=1397841 RepID=UPI003D35AB45
MRNFIEKIHLWLALPAGLIVTIVCLTGAILVFEQELLEWYYPERYFVEEQTIGTPLPLHELVEKVNEQLEENSVASVKIASDPDRTYTVGLQEGFRVSAFVNPYNGEIKGYHYFLESFFYKIMALHRWLMDGSRELGKVTVGITTIIFVILLITGMVLWVPVNKKKWRQQFTVNIRSGNNRFWRDLHITVGMYAFLLLLICSLTGLMWSFGWYRNTVFSWFGIEQQQGHGKKGKSSSPKEEINSLHWDQAFQELAQKNPGYQYIRIQDQAATVLAKDAVHKRAADKYTFDKNSGQINSVKKYQEDLSSSKIMTWAYALHVGDYGGYWGRVLTFLASLVGASLPLTGYYMFYIRKRKAYKSKRALEKQLNF